MPPRVLTLSAREFLRVSVDGSGRERSHEEQHTDNAAAAENHGLTLGVAYRETGSASRYARRKRDDFAKLLSDLKTGAFGAQVLVLWESSRGSRQVGEWVTLIEACEAAAVRIHVTTHGRTYDPANPRDRRSLLEDAIDSEYESAKTSQRAIRARAADAKDGKPNGPANFGYVRHYDPVTRKLVEQVPEPDEAKVIRELFDRLYKGHTLRSIEQDFKQRGILTRQRYDKDGKPLPRKTFSAQHLRTLAMTRAYCGEREHSVGKRGRQGGTQITYSKAVWPALVTKRRFLAVQAVLKNPARVTIRPGRGKHLLSMIVLCDVCGGPISAKRPDAPDAHYTCNAGGHIKVPYVELNKYVEGEILTYLGRPDNVERLTAGDHESEELAAVRDELADIRDELDDLAAKVARKALTLDFAARVEPGIRARQKAAEVREAELSAPNELGRLLDLKADITAFWRDAPMNIKRQITRILLSPNVLGELRITRSPVSHRPVPVRDRTVWRRD